VKVVILSDGKKGHLKQSLALAGLLKDAARTSGKAEVTSEKIVEIRYKSSIHRHFLWLAIPLLNLFEKEKQIFELLNHFLISPQPENLSNLQADVVISAGSSLLPIQHIIKKHLSGKVVVVMKPTGPYGARLWDLVVQPSHDGKPDDENVVSTLAALSHVSQGQLESYAKTYDEKLSLEGRRGISLFIGGSANGYRFSETALRTTIEHTQSFAHSKQVPFFVTTSRRTSSEINRLVKQLCEKDPLCKLLVIPAEKEMPNAVETMLGLSHTVLVTEESVSMISEALRSGRRVVSLMVGEKPLKGKKRDFLLSLKDRGWIRLAEPQELFFALESVQEKPLKNACEEDDEKIKERLLALL
jgi:mitochondrial fission protein ELM1